MKLRILSGIRASGKLHLGNYLGALKNWIDLQNQDNELCIFMIADYHAITTPFKPRELKNAVLDTAIQFLAAGLDPEKASLIRQSQMPQHTELAWIFNTITPISWLMRLPTYKEQLEKSPKYNHMGLLDYPVLMAADILIYKANLVPVGEDQLAHIDIANEIAKKFNSMFGQTFEPVRPHLTDGARIMSLQDPNKKMSKTPSTSSGQANEDSYIALSDSIDLVAAKLKKAVTDSGSEIKYDPEQKPAISNLVMLYHLLSGQTIESIEAQYQGRGYKEFKQDLAEVIINFLEPFQHKHAELSKNPDYVQHILTQGEKNATHTANSTLLEVKQKIGLL